MKYVIAKHPVTGYYLPAVFADEVEHVLVGSMLMMSVGIGNPRLEVLRDVLVGAGFVTGGGDREVKVVKDRGSDSLGIGPGELDELILKMFLEGGVAGLELANIVTYAQLKRRILGE